MDVPMPRTKSTKAKAVVNRKERASERDGKGRFTKDNPGRPKGSKNKVTVSQMEAAREMFSPIAEAALKKGTAHINKCNMIGCADCRWIVPIAWQYTFGKPTQPIDVDMPRLERKLAELSEQTGKSVEELLIEAERDGLPFIASGRRIA